MGLLGPQALYPAWEAQFNEVWMDGDRAQAVFRLYFLVLAVVRDADAREAIHRQDVFNQELTHLRGTRRRVESEQRCPANGQRQLFKGCRCEQRLDLVGFLRLESKPLPGPLLPGGVGDMAGGWVVPLGVVAGGHGPLEEPAVAADVGLFIGQGRCGCAPLAHVLIPPSQVRSRDRVEFGFLS